MKCVNCGGELDSQAIKCPYCGSRNQAGLAFYKDVYEKVNRNKLLAPLLLRQKTPELVQRMLTRIIIAMGMLGAVLMGISIGLFWLIDDPPAVMRLNTRRYLVTTVILSICIGRSAAMSFWTDGTAAGRLTIIG